MLGGVIGSLASPGSASEQGTFATLLAVASAFLTGVIFKWISAQLKANGAGSAALHVVSELRELADWLEKRPREDASD